MIEIRNVRRHNAALGRVILDDVSLAINEGESIGIVGPTGSGKSSLLRALARLDRWDSGELWFDGDQIGGDDVPAYRRKVVYVAQQATMITDSLQGDLHRIFEFAGASGQASQESAERQLTQLGKDRQLLTQAADQLSGGEKQIAALVRAMSLDPQVLLLDEPTASLDATSTEKVEQLVSQWRSAAPDHSVVWVSHDDSQIQRVATRVIRLENGRVTSDK